MAPGDVGMEALGGPRATSAPALGGDNENCGVGLGFCEVADNKGLRCGIFWAELTPVFL